MNQNVVLWHLQLDDDILNDSQESVEEWQNAKLKVLQLNSTNFKTNEGSKMILKEPLMDYSR